MPSADAVSFAVLVHEDSPTSGVYSGMSIIWFPVEGTGESSQAATTSPEPPTSLLTFVCGTRGLAPDEQILGRPGHARHLKAVRSHLASEHGISAWVKHDSTNLAEPFPSALRLTYVRFKSVFDRYGHYNYAAADAPREANRARAVVAAFIDFYAWERD